MAAKKRRKGSKKRSKKKTGQFPLWLLERNARKIGVALKKHNSDYYVGKD